jgi:hypothetical protein
MQPARGTHAARRSFGPNDLTTLERPRHSTHNHQRDAVATLASNIDDLDVELTRANHV